MAKDSTKTYKSSLCIRQHNFQNTGFSLYYRSTQDCVECVAERNRKNREQAKYNFRLYGLKWREENKEHKRLYDAAYVQDNKTQHRLNNSRYRANGKQASQIPFTESDWLKKYRHQFNGCCAYCQQRIDYENLTLDHLIPLDKGGEESLRNSLPCCKACNSSKLNRDVFKWLLDSDRPIPGWLYLLQTEEWFILSYYQAFKK